MGAGDLNDPRLVNLFEDLCSVPGFQMVNKDPVVTKLDMN